MQRSENGGFNGRMKAESGQQNQLAHSRFERAGAARQWRTTRTKRTNPSQTGHWILAIPIRPKVGK
jgi:hypothetical protein